MFNIFKKNKRSSWRSKFASKKARTWSQNKRSKRSYSLPFSWEKLKSLGQYWGSFSLAVIVVLFVGGFIYVRYFYLSRQIHQTEIDVPFCPFYQQNEEFDAQNAYGYFVTLNQEEITDLKLIHIGFTITQEKKITVIDISPDLWMTILDSSRFRYVGVDQLWRASLVEDPEKPLCHLVKNLGYQFGVPTDFILVENQEGDSSSWLQEQFLSSETNALASLLDTVNLLRKAPVSSNIIAADMIKLHNEFALNKGSIKEFALSAPSNAEEVIKDDGTKISLLRFDLFIDSHAGLLSANTVSSEQALIEIYNATDSNGLASLYSRYLSTIGGEVIRVGSLPSAITEHDVDIYISNENEYPITIEMVERVLPEREFMFHYNERPPGLVTTGDIIIVLHAE